MRDDVSILINGTRVEAAGDFQIVSDLFSPEGRWEIPVPPNSVDIKGADLVRIMIGDRAESIGLLDSDVERLSRSRHSVVLTGSTLAGIMQTSSILDWSTPPKMIGEADKRYTKDLIHVARFPVEIHKSGMAPVGHPPSVDVGTTVWQALSAYALSMGLVLWIRPDGMRVYGKVITDGAPQFVLDGSNIDERSRTRRWNELHSEVRLVSDHEDEGHRTVKVKNETAPVYRPFAAAFNGYSSDLEKQANAYVRQEKMRSLSLEYDVAGFSQAGKPWVVNALVALDDPELGMKGTYVIHRTAKSRSRDKGSRTLLTIGPVLSDPFKAATRKGRRSPQDYGSL